MNTRYHAALRLAEVILRNASAEAGDGKQHSASFVVDMSKVFEDFVGTALREAMAAYPGRCGCATTRCSTRRCGIPTGSWCSLARCTCSAAGP